MHCFIPWCIVCIDDDDDDDDDDDLAVHMFLHTVFRATARCLVVN